MGIVQTEVYDLLGHYHPERGPGFTRVLAEGITGEEVMRILQSETPAIGDNPEPDAWEIVPHGGFKANSD